MKRGYDLHRAHSCVCAANRVAVHPLALPPGKQAIALPLGPAVEGAARASGRGMSASSRKAYVSTQMGCFV